MIMSIVVTYLVSIYLPYSMDELLDLLDRSGRMPEELKLEIQRIMVFRTFARWEMLVKAGRVNEFLFFIVKGTARCFTLRSSGSDGEQEVNRRFLLEKDMFGSIYRFHQGVKEEQNVQALKPCVVLMTSIVKYEAAMEQYPDFYKFTYDTWCQTELKEDRVADMLRLPTAVERYEFLSVNFPELKQNIPQKYLASFMGLDATTLYKVKRKKKI